MEKKTRFLTGLTAVTLTFLCTSNPREPLQSRHPDMRYTNYGLKECTTAIISGEVTPDGRPLLWKNRDTDNPDQEFAYFDDGQYSYLTVIDANEIDQAFGGVNSVGFAIEDSDIENMSDTVAGPDDDGFIIRLALQTCRTVDDFAAILDSTNETGRTNPTSYGIIDAEGEAVIFEAGAFSYTRFDAADSADAPDGFLVRTTFAYSGDEEEHVSQWRHDWTYDLILEAIGEDALTPEYLLRVVASDLCLEDIDPYPLPFDSVYAGRSWPIGYIPTYRAINRSSTRSALVVQGILPDENPLLSTMYAIVNQPIVTVPIPLWVHSASTPIELDGDSTALLCDLANQFIDFIYNPLLDRDALNTFQLVDGVGGGLLTVTEPLSDTIFTRTQAALDGWRDELPEGEVMADFQNRQAEYAYEILSNWRRSTCRHVPDDFETIRSAILASAEGDTVLIHPGVYESPIEFLGRNIVVGSLLITTGDHAYIDSTIIDGNRNGRSAAVMVNGETENAVLAGLTLCNDSTGSGGGVYCSGASPTLSHLVIRDNFANRNGGGVYSTQGSHPTLIHVTMIGNTAVNEGGGVQCYDENSGMTIVNSIIRNNEPAIVQPWLSISFSNLEGGFDGTGNIDIDPLFVDPDNHNYHLDWANFPEDDETRSPCIDAGDSYSPVDPDMTNADIGAFHFYQGLPPDIFVDCAAIEFNDIQTETYVNQTINITNTGERGLVVVSQIIEYILGPPFIYISDGGGSFRLGANESHETVITFTPPIEGVYLANYHIDSNDPDESRVTIVVSGTSLSVGADVSNMPIEFGISSVFPNPFNTIIHICYGLLSPAIVTLKIYDITGREVAVLEECSRKSGYHAVFWDGSNLPTGQYLLRLANGKEVATRKIVLIK